MKKLLLVFLVFCSFQLVAQNQQIISITVGPNWLQLFSGSLADGPYYRPQVGWGAGLDGNFGLSNRLDIKVGLRYHKSVSIYENNYLEYPSEYATGIYVYDSTLMHSVKIEYQNKVWQYLVGTRLYFSQPRNWRWYTDGELGLTQFEQTQSSSPSVIFLTGGLGLGLQWLPLDKQFGVFVQPMMRYMVDYKWNEVSRTYAFIIPAIEIGLRMRIFTP